MGGELSAEVAELRRLLSFTIGHSNCYCEACREITRGHYDVEAICDALRERDEARDEVARLRGLPPDPERVAQLFHETYERLAPDFGYETRGDSAVPWEQVPEANRGLMVATAAAVLESLGDLV